MNDYETDVVGYYGWNGTGWEEIENYSTEIEIVYKDKDETIKIDIGDIEYYEL